MYMRITKSDILLPLMQTTVITFVVRRRVGHFLLMPRDQRLVALDTATSMAHVSKRLIAVLTVINSTVLNTQSNGILLSTELGRH